MANQTEGNVSVSTDAGNTTVTVDVNNNGKFDAGDVQVIVRQISSVENPQADSGLLPIDGESPPIGVSRGAREADEDEPCVSGALKCPRKIISRSAEIS